jgi:ribosome recycling factor
MDARISVYNEKMQKAYDYLEADYAAIRAGRANPHVLDKLRVDYYGTPTPIQQVGNITVPEARIIQIAPWEKSLIKAIEKAIMTSDVGIIRRDGNDAFKKLSKTDISEDEIKQLEDELQKQTDKFIKDIDALVDTKSKEIMTV